MGRRNRRFRERIGVNTDAPLTMDDLSRTVDAMRRNEMSWRDVARENEALKKAGSPMATEHDIPDLSKADEALRAVVPQDIEFDGDVDGFGGEDPPHNTGVRKRKRRTKE